MTFCLVLHREKVSFRYVAILTFLFLHSPVFVVFVYRYCMYRKWFSLHVLQGWSKEQFSPALYDVYVCVIWDTCIQLQASCWYHDWSLWTAVCWNIYLGLSVSLQKWSSLTLHPIYERFFSHHLEMTLLHKMPCTMEWLKFHFGVSWHWVWTLEYHVLLLMEPKRVSQFLWLVKKNTSEFK